MKIQSLIVAGAVLFATLAQSAPVERPAELPSTVCYPAFAALQEPTTEDNLTPYDPFNSIEDRLYASGVYPEAEPATMAMVMIILKEIAKVVGTKIYESIFKDGTKQSLTKADFDRIAQIVKEALREDAKRKINDCVINLQENHKFLATAWDENIAHDTLTTSSAIITNIVHFDHTWSRLGLFPSAMLIGSLQMGLAQEYVKRYADKDKKYFDAIRARTMGDFTHHLEKTKKELLDTSNQWVKFTSYSGKKCGSENEGYCYSVIGQFWGKTEYYHYSKCPRYPEGEQFCKDEMMGHYKKAEDLFKEKYWAMEKAVLGKVIRTKPRGPIEGWTYEHLYANEKIGLLPATQPQ